MNRNYVDSTSPCFYDDDITDVFQPREITFGDLLKSSLNNHVRVYSGKSHIVAGAETSFVLMIGKSCI